MKIAVALAITALALPCAAGAHPTSLNPCTLLSARQVAAVHVNTTCNVLRGKPNALYTGVSATWGKLAGKGSVIVAVDQAKSHAYVTYFEGVGHPGTSWKIGDWSRGTCTTGGFYCYASFVVGNNVVTIQVTPPQSKRIPVTKATKAMAKTIAAKLS